MLNTKKHRKEATMENNTIENALTSIANELADINMTERTGQCGYTIADSLESIALTLDRYVTHIIDQADSK
jgi:cell division protein ZapA (FtsZ GTPase activity inhibitor)